MTIIGLDIGGTKCAVVRVDENNLPVDKINFATTDVRSTLTNFFEAIERRGFDSEPVFGISCGGPLDSSKGIIMSPPNLPDWENIAIIEMLKSRFGGRAFLMNDANAGALAEWQHGAGKGFSNIIFLTCGTGMGAGIILNNRLYEGTSGMAGEVGHIRLAETGPIGYNKAGSFEGFCSASGIVKLAKQKAAQAGGWEAVQLSRSKKITARELAEAARAGNAFANDIFDLAGRYLGQGLSILIDIFNPQVVILGRFYYHCRQLFEPAMREVLEKEALQFSLDDCRIIPTGLGDEIGDYAAISVALYKMKELLI